MSPLDQGVIKPLKTQYKQLKVIVMLQEIENGEDAKSLNFLDAIIMISETWKKVTQTP